MGRQMGPWWAKHRTVIFAITLSVGMAIAVRDGRYQASRAIFPLSVVWALAFHSVDSRKVAERMEAAVDGVRKAQADAQEPRG